jgi:hypothetical protein
MVAEPTMPRASIEVLYQSQREPAVWPAFDDMPALAAFTAPFVGHRVD